MNANNATLSGPNVPNVPFIETQSSHTPVETDRSRLGLKDLSRPDDKPAPQSLADFTITKAEHLATIRAQDNLTTRFHTLCTNDDGDTLARILSGMSEEEVLTWLSTALPFSERHDTPMMYVARHNCVSMTSALLRHKADPVEINPHSKTGSHPLYIAAQENNVDIIRLMSTADTFAPDVPRTDGDTAIFAAVNKNHLEATKFLLECNANPNYKFRAILLNGEMRPIQCVTEDEAARGSEFWFTLMNVAAAQNQTPDSVKIVELLLSKGGKVENIDPDNPIQQSPLAAAVISAITNGHSCENIVELLLSHGAEMFEPMPIQLNPASPDLNISSDFVRAAKLKVRPSICEFVCTMVASNPDNFPFVKIFHEYSPLQKGEEMSLKEFIEINSEEGFVRAAAAYDTVFEAIAASPTFPQPSQPNSTTAGVLQAAFLEGVCSLDDCGITITELFDAFGLSNRGV